MNKNTNDLVTKKNYYQFRLDTNRSIIISSQFDNGNISLVKQQNQLSYRLSALSDSQISGNKKSWFYFYLKAPKNIQIKIIIENVNILEAMYDETNWAKPVCRQGTDGEWKQLKNAFLTYRDEVQLNFDYSFTDEKEIYFALTIPFTFQENQRYIKNLKYKIPNFVEFTDNIIALSCQGRPIHLLTIEDNQSQLKSKEKLLQIIGSVKPIVLITARVHPGEVSSSYCLMGIIEFLLSSSSLQAYLLRKMFKFVIVPLVNPDGVYEGHYRMDTNGVNLNRIYSHPEEDKHPSIYHICNYIQQQISKTKIQYYFDLHSHSAHKPAFIYGNAYDDIICQTESELYCKILQHENTNFKYNLSLFGQKHMKSKDKGQNLTKQGCARVVVSKLANVINSYTVESSIFPYPVSEPNKDYLPSNTKFELGQFYFSLPQRTNPNQLIQQNMELGEALMISILQHVDKNPYNRLSKDLKHQFRKQISSNLFQNQQRFKMLDIKAYAKVKNIVKLCQQEFQNKYARQWAWLGADSMLVNVPWPSNFKWFQIAPYKSAIKSNLKVKTESNESPTKSQARYLQKYQPLTCFPKKIQKQRFQLVTKEVICMFENTSVMSKKTTEVKRQKITIDKKQNQEYDGQIQQKQIKSQHTQTIDLDDNPKKNQIIQFIKDEINKLNQQKLGKILPIFPARIFRSKVSTDKQSLKKQFYVQGSVSSQKLNANLNENLLMFSNENPKVINNEQNKCEQIISIRQRCLTYSDEMDSMVGLSRRLNTINSKRQVIKSKNDEIKKKLIREQIKLPQLSKLKLIIDAKSKKVSKRFTAIP